MTYRIGSECNVRVIVIEEEGKPNRAIFDKVLKGIELFIKEAIWEFNLDEQQIDIDVKIPATVPIKSIRFITLI